MPNKINGSCRPSLPREKRSSRVLQVIIYSRLSHPSARPTFSSPFRFLLLSVPRKNVTKKRERKRWRGRQQEFSQIRKRKGELESAAEVSAGSRRVRTSDAKLFFSPAPSPKSSEGESEGRLAGRHYRPVFEKKSLLSLSFVLSVFLLSLFYSLAATAALYK